MLARLLGVFKQRRAQATYVFVIAALLAITEIGHSTKWTFFLAGSTTATNAPRQTPEAKSPRDVEPKRVEAAQPPAAPAKKEIRITAVDLEKSGIKLDAVSEQAMEQSLVAPGIVDYNRNLVAQLSTRVAGNVWRVEKQVGQMAHKGDILAIVEAIEVGKAKSEFLQAVVASETAAKTLERMKLVDRSLPERQLREAEAVVRETKIQLANAQQTLVNLGLPIRMKDIKGLADEELSRHVQFLGLPQSLVSGLDPASTTGNLVPLVSPFDGIVIGRAIVVGEVVSPTQPTFTVADISQMWILLEVRKEDANLVHVGQPFAFTADGIPGEVRGEIDWISTEVDEQTRTLQVRAEVNNPLIADNHPGLGEQRLLRARTYGTGRIQIRQNAKAVVVPSDAVQFDGVKHIVFVREGELFIRREVRPGTMQDGHTEILTGLSPGEIVATVGSHVLKAELQLAAASN